MTSLRKHVDLVCYTLFTVFCFLSAARFETPVLASERHLLDVCALYLLGMAGGLLAARLLFRRGRAAFPSLAEGLSPTTYRLFVAGCLALLVLLLGSWAAAFQKYAALVPLSWSFAFRAITTSYHSLVPLESRLLYTLIPLALCFPTRARSPLLTKIFFGTALFIAFVTQTKVGLLLTGGVGALFLLSSISPWATSRATRAGATVVLLVATWACFVAMNRANDTIEQVTSSPLLPRLAVDPSVTLPDSAATYPCRTSTGGISEKLLARDRERARLLSTAPRWKATVLRGYWDTTSMAENLLDRSFSLPAKVIRLFVCLRDEGWRPGFHGHQLFRLWGGYVPYYRLAYQQYRPTHWSSANSAVTGAAADSYFNAGLGGVFVAGIVTALLWLLLVRLGDNALFTPLCWYYRGYFLLVLSQGSILSGIVTLLPLFLLMGADRVLRLFAVRPSQAQEAL